MPRSHEQITAEIISKLDLAAEYKAMGVEFVGTPRASGSHECWAIDRPHGNHPSAFVNLETGRYIDKGGTGENLSLFDFAVKYGKQFTDWRDVRKHLADKAGVHLGRGRPPENPNDQLEFEPWTDGNERLATIWCAIHKKGTSLESIKAAGGRVAFLRYRDKKNGEWHRTKYKCIVLPCWGEAGVNSEPVAWVAWNISGGDLEIFRGKDLPSEKVKMRSVGQTRGAMMGMHGLLRLAEGSNIAVVWKTAGPSDMLALWSLIPPDLRDSHLVVTNASSETGDVLPHQAALLVGQRVYVAHDADTAGEIGAAKWCKELAAVASEVRHVKLPWPVEAKGGKDIRNFILDLPAELATADSLAAAVPGHWLSPAPPVVNVAFAAPAADYF